jgi:hypothetical protein
VSAAVLLPAAAAVVLVILVCRRAAARRRPGPSLHTGVHPLHSLTAPDHRPLPDPDLCPAVVDGWRTVAVTSTAEAEGLLDWLELAGVAERELVRVGEACVLVRWR